MDAPFFFPHGDHPTRRSSDLSKMNVAHLRESVTHGIVNRSLADFSSLDVCYWNSECQRNGCRREHFIAVSDQEKQVRAHLSQEIAETQRGNANCLGHSHVAVRAQQAFDSSMDIETIFLNLLKCVTKFGRKVGPEGDDFQVHVTVIRKITQRPI